MLIDNKLIEQVVELAKTSPRLRANYLLHSSEQDKVQKMVNVLLPGTEIPIHRHLNSDETLVILQGEIEVVYFNMEGEEIERFILSKDCGCYAIDIHKGQWHTVFVSQPVVVMEIKEGPYRPLQENEIVQ